MYKANDIKNEFAQDLFKMSYGKLDKMYKTNTYDWLPTLDFSSVSKINSKHFGTFLPKLFKDLQVLGAGIDLVFSDEKYENFKDIKYNFRLLLCEIFTVIYECHLVLLPDVTADVIPDDCVSLKDETAIKTRDFIIFREYIKMLEYILKVFRNHTPKSALIIKNMY